MDKNLLVILTFQRKNYSLAIQKFSKEFNPSLNSIGNLNIFDGIFFVKNIVENNNFSCCEISKY